MKEEEVLKYWEDYDIEELSKFAMEYFSNPKKLTPKQYSLYMWEELRPFIEADPRTLPQKQEKKINKYKDWRKYEQKASEKAK